MPSFELDGRTVPYEPGDTIAAAAHRAGVRVFSRSLKYHRPRGLYCLSGDCPNCLVTVDGRPGTPACMTAAQSDMEVTRERGWPSADHDLLSVLWRLRRTLPVGFYYKTFLRPASTWRRVEPLVRGMTGLGAVPPLQAPSGGRLRHVHADVAVVGAGGAGLAAALAAAERGRVVVLEAREVAPRGLGGNESVRFGLLADAVRSHPEIQVLECSTAFAFYGDTLAAAAPDAVLLVHAKRVVVATGAVERHLVAPGADSPGVWLSRGAMRLATEHGLAPGQRIAYIGPGGRARAALAAVGANTARVLSAEDRILEVKGGPHGVKAVIAELGGKRVSVACDALVASIGLLPRDGLLRQAPAHARIAGAGDAALPGCSFDDAVESGHRAGLGGMTRVAAPPSLYPRSRGGGGCVCLCEDVYLTDLETAWTEGFRSSELLKRYTTAAMGPCQGALCQAPLREFVAGRGAENSASAATTARPPAGSLTVAEAAGADLDLEYRTALHERHLGAGARMEWMGHWLRPWDYGDAVEEYQAVRNGVSIMDIGSLGKFEIAGPDAEEFIDRIYPISTRNLAVGRQRYALLLDERGHVFDDGLVCRLGDRRFYLTLSTAGALHGEMWFQQWADTWGLRVRIANVTSALGTIVVAGPEARVPLARLVKGPVDGQVPAPGGTVSLTVAGVGCRVLRSGFLGEVAFELHHASEHSARLWDELLEAGDRAGIRPHGLAAQDLLRLEKGHIVVGIDTDFDTTPSKLGLEHMVAVDKAFFVGKKAAAQARRTRPKRGLVAVAFPPGHEPQAGSVLSVAGDLVGHLTSAGFSPTLGHGVGLGWVKLSGGRPPKTVHADGVTGRVVKAPFYDPAGSRVAA